MTTKHPGAPRVPMGERVDRWLTEKTQPEGDCLIWTGALDTSKTRGVVGIMEGEKLKLKGVNRVIWEHEHPDETLTRSDVVATSCGRQLCIKPEHLEKMTRDERVAQIVASRETCGKGHPRTPENVRVNADGSRSCRACDREGTAARRAAGKKS